MYNLTLITESMAKRVMMNINGHIGYIRGIQMEDGSGHNYNISMLVGGKTITTFVRATLNG